MNKNESLTSVQYNIGLLFVFILFQAGAAFFDHAEGPTTVFDVMFENDALMGWFVLLAIFLISAVICIILLRSFWARFVSPLFNVRGITINEAVSIVLILSIVTT